MIENGGGKVCHGSGGGGPAPGGGETAPFCPFWRQGGRGHFHRGTVSEGSSRHTGRDECARGGASLWDFAREREEDAAFFGTAGVSAERADQAAAAGRVHRGHRAVAAR